jgi:hypothetical protein
MTANNDLLIEVLKSENIQDGYYSIEVKTSLQQPTLAPSSGLCVVQLFTAQNIPLNATLSWQSNTIVFDNTTSNPVTVTDIIGSAPYTFNLNVVSNGCTYTITKSFNAIGTIETQPYLVINQIDNCNVMAKVIHPPLGAIYEWGTGIVPEYQPPTTTPWAGFEFEEGTEVFWVWVSIYNLPCHPAIELVEQITPTFEPGEDCLLKTNTQSF